jgi:hypothetical protein
MVRKGVNIGKLYLFGLNDQVGNVFRKSVQEFKFSNIFSN